MLFAGVFGVAPGAPTTPDGLRPGTLVVLEPGLPPIRPPNYRQLAREEAARARAAYDSALTKAFATGEQAVRSGGTDISNASAAEAVAVAQEVLSFVVSAEQAAAAPVVNQAAYEKAKAQASVAVQKKNRVDVLFAIAKSDADTAVAVMKLRVDAEGAATSAEGSAAVAKTAAGAAQDDARIALTIRAETAATEAVEFSVAAEKAAIEARNSSNTATATHYTNVVPIQVASATAVALSKTAEVYAMKARLSADVAAEEAGKGSPPSDLDKWYTKPWVWAVIGGGVLVVGGGSYFVFRR
ncbi:hypothetical protein LCGC14_0522800 [marine sediment metagenome]|uniref:Uncharacterized protein n=1 Tax=marine sediment metagenome TaxID=412755 RepID=A0A0F9V674_9ZZZZ